MTQMYTLKGEDEIFNDEIHKIFQDRSSKITGHDPWRYGEQLSLLTDEIEFNWLKKNFDYNDEDVIIDIGCGTGRHVQMMAQEFKAKKIIGCDFIQKNIDFLRLMIEENELENVEGVVCSGVDFSEHVGVEKCNYIIAIGLVQYLVTDGELQQFVDCCEKLLQKGGSVILKHPLSSVPSYIKDYVREEMDTRYIAKYHDLNDLMKPFLSNFELMKIERTFTIQNSGVNLEKIESDERARQMWIHLVKK